MVEIIRKAFFHTYYLKHKFSEALIEQKYQQSNFTYNTAEDFLTQNGRWKIGNNGLVFCNE